MTDSDEAVQPDWTHWNVNYRGLREEYSEEAQRSFRPLAGFKREIPLRDVTGTLYYKPDGMPASEFWKQVREIGAERRRDWVRRVLEGDPTLYPRPVTPGWLEWLREHRADRLTERQIEALELTWGRHLSQREAAEASRFQPCDRNAYRKRIAGAELKAAWLLEIEAARTIPWEDHDKPAEEYPYSEESRLNAALRREP